MIKVEKINSTISSILTRFFPMWAHLDSNQEPAGYEPAALPIELWALNPFFNYYTNLYFFQGSKLFG